MSDHHMTTAIQQKPNAAVAPRKMGTLAVETTERLASATTSAVAAFNAAQGDNNVVAALDVAKGIADLRELFDTQEVKERVLALQDKAIGFRTDKDPTRKQRGKDGSEYFPTPYAYEIVKDCAIEATLRGLQLVGNQFNILAGRMYATREGYEHLIRKQKSVTDFTTIIHVPKTSASGQGVLIECEASWKFNGISQAIKATIPVKTDNYSTLEQSMGKATRKFLKRCYEKMTGNAPSDGDVGDVSDAELQAAAPTAEPPKFSRKPKAEPTVPTPAPEIVVQSETTPEATPETVKPDAPAPTEMGELQARFAEFCADSGVSLEDALSWFKSTGRWPQADDATSFADIPEAVLTALLGAKNDLAKMVKIFGKVVGK